MAAEPISGCASIQPDFSIASPKVAPDGNCSVVSSTWRGDGEYSKSTFKQSPNVCSLHAVDLIRTPDKRIDQVACDLVEHRPHEGCQGLA